MRISIGWTRGPYKLLRGSTYESNICQTSNWQFCHSIQGKTWKLTAPDFQIFPLIILDPFRKSRQPRGPCNGHRSLLSTWIWFPSTALPPWALWASLARDARVPTLCFGWARGFRAPIIEVCEVSRNVVVVVALFLEQGSRLFCSFICWWSN